MINARAISGADIRPFGIADWLEHARTRDGTSFRIADRNCHVAGLADAGTW